MNNRQSQRFSGHESFVCRYGWLPKLHRAVVADPAVLRNEERAMHTLGIGRNMVKSIQFWGEATGVIRSREGHGHRPGPVGDRLFGRAGWDEYLETLESLWLLHWWITTKASLAAWDEVFGEGGLQRFDKRGLVEALARRGEGKARTLVASTLEQHASIFLQTYYQESRGIDDTSWCPLQDLALLTASRDNEGQVAFATNLKAPVGLTLRLFSAALVEFLAGYEGQTVALSEVLRSAYSPGIVF